MDAGVRVLSEPPRDSASGLTKGLGRISETHRRDEVWMPTATGHLASIMESMDFAAAF